METVRSEQLNDTDGQKSGEKAAFSASQLLEVIGSAWPGQEVDYHRLYLFDRLQRGEHDWNFLIATRRQDGNRLELAAVAFELDESGAVTTRLESRKASIPSDRIAEVIEGVLLRLDEADCDYTEYDLSGMTGLKSQAEHLAELAGIPTGISDEADEHSDDLQPGESDRQ